MQSRTNGGQGHFPDVQHKTGTGSAVVPNRKSIQRKDSGGPVAGQGDAVEAKANPQSVTGADWYPGREAPNRFYKGDGSTEPDPATVNRGYSVINDNTVPAVRECTSANRDNFGFDPGAVDNVPAGDTDSTPTKPSYGVGGTGD